MNIENFSNIKNYISNLINELKQTNQVCLFDQKERVIVCFCNDEFISMINPKITRLSKIIEKQNSKCYKCHKLLGEFSKSLEIEYQDDKGQTHQTMFVGNLAQLIQHSFAC
jgi:peptide deformylase